MAEIELPVDSQKRLIEIARQTLEDVASGRPRRKFSDEDGYLKSTNYGAFVSLFSGDELRGCIGTCTPSQALSELVVEMTEAAATRDPRVAPIRADELERIRIDISVLSPLAPAKEPLSLEVGRHGIHISRSRQRAVLLPQVALEHGWDIETFLQQTCLKANLPKDAWHWPDTKVSSFTAMIIEEEK
ncbi:MAG TPA: AmmeMemoRadiSam system protein A [Candidatus Binatus sp.]|nr:AmmeMemoRadiSam system protein A [Candidatus Binatus sp.]